MIIPKKIPVKIYLIDLTVLLFKNEREEQIGCN